MILPLNKLCRETLLDDFGLAVTVADFVTASTLLIAVFVAFGFIILLLASTSKLSVAKPAAEFGCRLKSESKLKFEFFFLRYILQKKYRFLELSQLKYQNLQYLPLNCQYLD